MPSPPGQCRAAVGGDGGLNMRQAAAGRKRGVGLCPLEWTSHHWCRRDPVNAIDRITIDPAVCGGRPCIRGMRVRVKDVLDLLAAGASRDEILADYPYLDDEDITAVLEFAARQNDHPVLRSA